MSVDTPIFKDGSAGGAETDLVKNTTTKDFMRDVVEASREVPVLVDFWAPWCGPCRQLTPILEKAVRAAKGAVRLVKLNIDDHPQIPGQMGVQSIPAVFAFQDGRPVDGFMGALPEIARQRLYRASDRRHGRRRCGGPRSRRGGACRRRRQHRGAAVRRDLAAGSRERAKPCRTRQVLHQDRRSRPRRADAGARPSGKGRNRSRGKRARRLELARKPPPADTIETLRAKLAADPKMHRPASISRWR